MLVPIKYYDYVKLCYSLFFSIHQKNAQELIEEKEIVKKSVTAVSIDKFDRCPRGANVRWKIASSSWNNERNLTNEC